MLLPLRFFILIPILLMFAIYEKGFFMYRFDGLLSWIVFVVGSAAALLLSLYVFAFLLPFVLAFIGIVFLVNLGRYWFYKYKFLEKLSQFTEKGTRSSSSSMPKDVIDVEYEVIDKKSKK